MRRLRDRYPREAYANTIMRCWRRRPTSEQALISLKEALDRNPKLVSAHLLRTRILLDQGERDAALAGLAKAVAAIPRDRSLRMDYARLLVDAGQLDKARREFAILLNQNPKDTDSLYALGVLATETRQFDLAESYFLDLIKRNTRLADAYFELGRIEEQREDYGKANEVVRAGHQRRSLPHRPDADGRGPAKAGDTAAVSQHFDTLRRKDPQKQHQSVSGQAEALREGERYQEAFDTLDRALALHTDDKDLLYARALVAEQLSRVDVLERDLRAILASDPKNGQALNALGYTWRIAPTATRKRWAISSKRWSCCPKMPPCSTAWAGSSTGWATTPRLCNTSGRPTSEIRMRKSPRTSAKCCGSAVSARKPRKSGGKHGPKRQTARTFAQTAAKAAGVVNVPRMSRETCRWCASRCWGAALMALLIVLSAGCAVAPHLANHAGCLVAHQSTWRD